MDTDLSYQDLDLIEKMASWTEVDARSNLHGEENHRRHALACDQADPARDDIGYEKVTV